MMIYNVADEAFRPYGRIVEGYDVEGILEALKKTPVPDNVIYTPREDAIHQAEHAQESACLAACRLNSAIAMVTIPN